MTKYFFASFVITLLVFSGCRPRTPVPEPVDPVSSSRATGVNEAINEPIESVQDISNGSVGNIGDSEPGSLEPLFFDYDRSEIRADQVPVLQRNAGALKQNPALRVQIEGHCDERGTEEYNQALGDRRASITREYLIRLGVDSSRLYIVSYGEDRPFAFGHGEDAWSQNRRAHFSPQ